MAAAAGSSMRARQCRAALLFLRAVAPLPRLPLDGIVVIAVENNRQILHDDRAFNEDAVVAGALRAAVSVPVPVAGAEGGGAGAR